MSQSKISVAGEPKERNSYRSANENPHEGGICVSEAVYLQRRFKRFDLCAFRVVDDQPFASPRPHPDTKKGR
jgi:hypothetical protein